MRLIVYTRRSTDEQEDSQSVQERFAREWCMREGHTLVEVCHEIPISGSKTVERRPVLAEIRARLKDKNRGFDALLVWKLDRLFRNPGEQYKWLEILDKAKCALYSVTETVDRETAHGRFVHHLMMGVSALERELCGERIYAHNLSMALSGRWPAGKAPVGLTYDPATKTLSASDRAHEAVRVFDLYIKHGGNAAATARTLNAEGIVSREGSIWRSKSVLSLVRSTVYRQQLKYDGRIIDAPDLIPRIVPVELTQVVDTLLARDGYAKGHSIPRERAYSGFLYCSQCGNRLWVHGNLRPTVAWMCRGRADKLCSGHSVSNKYVDRLMGMALTKVLSVYKKRIAQSTVAKPKGSPNSRIIRTNLEAMKKRIKELFINGRIDLAEFDRRTDEIDKQIAGIKPEQSQVTITPKIAEEWLEQLEKYWPDLTDEEKRELLTLINARMVLNTGERPLWIEITSHLNDEPIRVAFRFTSN